MLPRAFRHVQCGDPGTRTSDLALPGRQPVKQNRYQSVGWHKSCSNVGPAAFECTYHDSSPIFHPPFFCVLSPACSPIPCTPCSPIIMHTLARQCAEVGERGTVAIDAKRFVTVYFISK